jgi:hypothetical protein
LAIPQPGLAHLVFCLRSMDHQSAGRGLGRMILQPTAIMLPLIADQRRRYGLPPARMRRRGPDDIRYYSNGDS